MRQVFVIATSLLIASPALALAAPRTFQELSIKIVELINLTIPVLILAGIVIYLYGVSTNILNFSDDSREKVRAYFFWGIVILFVMLSIWGILNLLKNTFLSVS